MIIETDDLIKEYYDTVKDKYGIDFEHFKMICKVPFVFFKKMMALPDLPIIKVKYFGTFLIWPGTAKTIIEAVTKKFQSGLIGEEEFINQTVNLKRHLDEYEAEGNDDFEEGETPD